MLAPEDAAPGDTVAAHIADTLAAGAGLNDAEAVRVLCTEAVRDIAGAAARSACAFDADARRRPGPGPGSRTLGRRASCTPAGTPRAPASPATRCIERRPGPRRPGRLRAETSAFVPSSCRPAPSVRHSPGARRTAAGSPACDYLPTDGRSRAGRRRRPARHRRSRAALRPAPPTPPSPPPTAWPWPGGPAPRWRTSSSSSSTPPPLAAAGDPGRPAGPADLRGRPRRGRRAAGRRGVPLHARLPPRRRTRPPRRRLPQHRPAPGRHRRRADSPVYLDARGIEAARGAGFLARRFPTITPATRAAGYDWTARTRPRRPGRALLDGRRGTDLRGRTSVPGPVRRRRGRLHRGRRAPTGWPATRCWRASCSAAGRSRTSCARPVARHHAPRAGSAAGGLPLTHASAAPSPATVTSSERRSSERAPKILCSSVSAGGVFSRDALRRLMTADAGVMRSGGSCGRRGRACGRWAAVVHPETAARTGRTGCRMRTGTCCSPPGCSWRRPGTGRIRSAPTTAATR